MSTMGIPDSGTIRLSDIADALANESGTEGANTLTTPGYGYVSSPSQAEFAKVELYGAGGGGAGYESATTEYGGGGGGYVRNFFKVPAGGITLGYRVGAGGAGGAISLSGGAGQSTYVNNVPGHFSANGGLYTSSGLGGSSTSGGSGGTDRNIGNLGNNNSALFCSRYNMTQYTEAGEAGGVGTYWHGGDCAGPAGGAGAATTYGENGGDPGGGGSGNYYFTPGVGGNGGNGKIIITWYDGITATGSSKLHQDYRSLNGNRNPNRIIGLDGYVPSSGTIRLRDFRGGELFGFQTSNNYYYALSIIGAGTGNNRAGYYSQDQDLSTAPDTATANAYLRLYANGLFVHNGGAYDFTRRMWDGDSDDIHASMADQLQIRIDQQYATVSLSGSSANTWLNLNAAPFTWHTTISRSFQGESNGYAHCNMRIRLANSTELANVPFNFYVEVEVWDDFGDAPP